MKIEYFIHLKSTNSKLVQQSLDSLNSKNRMLIIGLPSRIIRIQKNVFRAANVQTNQNYSIKNY